MSLKVVDGWWWPEYDTECQRYAHSLASLKEALGYCYNFRTAIQAGGNVGIWPEKLSRKFDIVHTAEPDDLNFECLEKNVRAANVIKHKCGLGFEMLLSGLILSDNNCGMPHMSGEGHIPIIRIDTMGVKDVDLICLDVEGMELPALKGAVEVIERDKPIILTEEKNLGMKYGYGYEDKEIEAFLRGFSYCRKAKIGNDVIYTPFGEKQHG